MKLNKLIVIVVVTLFGILIILNYRLDQKSQIDIDDSVSQGENSTIENCIPTFKDGGGPYYQSNSPFREKIVPEENSGDPLIIEGRILYNDCKSPVSGAVLDIWQANESGSYEHEWYRGQVTADEEGNYSFETVVPEGYGSGTGYRPPHIHFKVHLEGSELITSQMFFPEALGREGFSDAYIMKLEEITNDSGEHTFKGYHDIVLPLAREDF